jgi:dTDP-4-dehydrorhamnose reductase
MTVLIIGANGRLGACLSRTLQQAGHTVLPYSREQLDLSEPASIVSRLEAVQYDLVIITAAATHLDWCEQNPDAAYAINTHSVEQIATAAYQRKAKLIFFSTDYVYDGIVPGLKLENAPLLPISVYAKSKLDAENAVTQIMGQDAMILRISWLFGPDKPAFPEHVLSQAQKNEPLKIITDKYSSPTYVLDLAAFINHVLSTQPFRGGIYNFANEGCISWFELAQYILEEGVKIDLCDGGFKIDPIKMKDLSQFIAARPVHTAMDTQKIKDVFSFSPKNWQDVITGHLIHIKKSH